MDKTIASFFYENGISFNVADSSRFAPCTHDRRGHPKQNPFQSFKAPSRTRLSRELLDQAYRSTEQLVAPILAIAIKLGSTIRLHAHSPKWRSGGDSATSRWRLAHALSTRSGSGPRRQGAPFSPRRESPRPGSAPRRGSANPEMGGRRGWGWGKRS